MTYRTYVHCDQGGAAIAVHLLRDGDEIAVVPIADWCELEAVKEWGGEPDEEQLARDAAANDPVKQAEIMNRYRMGKDL